MKSLIVIDLMGTAVFAAEGASTAATARLDVLGILVIGFVTALGGGIIRDLLLGYTPPSSIRDWRYGAVALITGTVVFLFHASTADMNYWLLTSLDAAGLSLFAVAGVEKAMEFKLHPLLAVMMGGITGVGGGTVRDLLLNRVPTVLRSDVYAAAALLGAAITILCLKLKMPPTLASVLGIVSCFVLRMVAVYNHWNLPGASS
ncbi:trimeric intracellular cation channel family protein [Acidicapsa ligni]|uniref:trimeric intracellular cation channel family protein n=1 Tax=Acidicapsa ligni TaxID=542300 RepID=UPI0021DF5ECA|nr:TRIC cation channel family protein [Acidicapsa ligni]